MIFAGLIVIDAKKDLRAPLQPIGNSLLPAMMVESNDRKLTLAISSSATTFGVLDNVKEAMSVNGVALPGATESAVIAVDNTKAYFAVPTARFLAAGPQGASSSRA